MIKRIVTVVGIFLLCGCQNFNQFNDKERSKQFADIDEQSSYPVTRREYFERINILELVDPEHAAETAFPVAWKAATADPSQKDDLNQYGAWYDLAFAYFRQRKDITDEQKKVLRDSIQERIISASVSRCNVFKTYLRRQQTDVNFNFGAATTASGALGAIVSGQVATRALAGAAGLFSGIRAEYNQAYYANLTAQVIIKGIEVKQQLVYKQIQTEGQTKSITNYPLEAAIKDAIYFDGLCSTVVGLTQAGASVDATVEPGLEAAARTILRARIVREAADLPREQLLNADALKKFEQAAQQVGISLIGSARGEPVTQKSDVDPFVFATDLSQAIASAGKPIGIAIEQAASARRKEIVDEMHKKGLSTQTEDKNAPKDGAIADEVTKAVTANIIAPLKFDLCYAEYVAQAVQKRESAIKDRAKAQGADIATADFKLKEALRNVDAANDQLKLRQQYLNLDLEKYRTSKIAAIKAKTKLEDLDNPKAVAGSPAPDATKGQACKAPAA